MQESLAQKRRFRDRRLQGEFPTGETLLVWQPVLSYRKEFCVRSFLWGEERPVESGLLGVTSSSEKDC